jgi:hypothetical protein
MSAYQINIGMSAETVEELRDEGMSLFAFKAVRSSLKGAPLVWLMTNQFSTSTAVGWDDQFEAYTSWMEIVNGAVIEPAATCGIVLGQQAVTGAEGDIAAQGGGPSGAISIQNGSSMPLTVGMGQAIDGSVQPMCAFSLSQAAAGTIAPLGQVMLMFSTVPLMAGTVVEQAYSPGVLVTFAGPSQAGVSFDINNGWSWGGGVSARSIQPGTDLVGLLIQH